MLASRGIFPPRDQTQVSCVSCIASGFSTVEPSGKPLQTYTILDLSDLVDKAKQRSKSF